MEASESPEAGDYDHHRTQVLNGSQCEQLRQQMLQQPFSLDKKKIPACLPIQRGIHLCNETFTHVFKEAYSEEASVLAAKLEEAKYSQSEFTTNDPSTNKLFNLHMFKLLYARDLFKFKVEGSFSNARAMAQLRQYYIRMIDREDQMGTQQLWEDQRINYESTIRA